MLDLLCQIWANISEKVAEGTRYVRIPCDHFTITTGEGAARGLSFFAGLPNKAVKYPPSSLGVLSSFTELSGKIRLLKMMPEFVDL